MKKTFIAILFFFFAIANGQIIFEKGYFINNNGIRTACLIENVDWRNNPRSFNYKLDDTAITKTENIMGVAEFGVDDVSMFRRYTVKMERSPNDTKYLIKGNNPQWKEETVFLKAMVTGEANLYSFTDENIIRYFYETKQIPTEQLVYIKYLDDGGRNRSDVGLDTFSESIKENNQFRQQLLNSLKCSMMSESDFKSLAYKKNALAEVFEKYNKCSGSTAASKSFTKEDVRKSFAIRVTPGIYSASVKISDPRTYYNASTDIKNEIVFKFGLEAEYILPFNKGMWSVFLNPGYQKFEAEKQYTRNTNLSSVGDINYTASASYTSIEVPIGVRRYFFVGKSSKIFLNVAYVIDVSLSDPKIVFTNSNNSMNANETLPISSRNNLAVGVGFAFNRFSAELRMNTPRELSNYLEWSAKYTTTGLTLGYQFL